MSSNTILFAFFCLISLSYYTRRDSGTRCNSKKVKTLISAEMCEAFGWYCDQKRCSSTELSRSNIAADISPSGNQGEKS